jgi:hypothetical protein
MLCMFNTYLYKFYANRMKFDFRNLLSLINSKIQQKVTIVFKKYFHCHQNKL